MNLQKGRGFRAVTLEIESPAEHLLVKDAAEPTSFVKSISDLLPESLKLLHDRIGDPPEVCSYPIDVRMTPRQARKFGHIVLNEANEAEQERKPIKGHWIRQTGAPLIKYYLNGGK